MNARRKATLVVAALATLAAGIAVGAPALAGNGYGPDADGWPAGPARMEHGRMHGEHGYGPGDGICRLIPDYPDAELPGDQAETPDRARPGT